MSTRRRDPEPGPDPEPGGTPPGNLRPTQVPTLFGWAFVGLVGGWLVHWACDWWGLVPPLVSVVQPLGLLLVAAFLGYVAWGTRAVHVRRERLEAHQALNRLAFARACAQVVALVGGGYVGYGLSWIGDPAELGDERLVRSLIAAGCALVAVVAALLLERACRVRHDGD